MSYESFRRRVSAIAKSTGSSVSFHHEDGKHIARCSGGVTITGNTYSPRVFVRWGSGHEASAII